MACSVTDGNITLLDRDGKNLWLCRANWLSGTYKRVSSLIKHSDPTTSVFWKQSQGNYAKLTNRWREIPSLSQQVWSPGSCELSKSFWCSYCTFWYGWGYSCKNPYSLNSAQSHLVGPTLLVVINGPSSAPSGAMGSVNIADTLLANNDIKNTIIEALRWKQLDIVEQNIFLFLRELLLLRWTIIILLYQIKKISTN